MATSDADLVRHLLARSGIHPDDEDVDSIVAGYPAARAMADRLHAVPTGDWGPALTLDTGPAPVTGQPPGGYEDGDRR